MIWLSFKGLLYYIIHHNWCSENQWLAYNCCKILNWIHSKFFLIFRRCVFNLVNLAPWPPDTLYLNSQNNKRKRCKKTQFLLPGEDIFIQSYPIIPSKEWLQRIPILNLLLLISGLFSLKLKFEFRKYFYIKYLEIFKEKIKI